MFNFEHSIDGDIDLSKVWELYFDVSHWKKWDKELESVTLQGEFVKGSAGGMKMKNGQSLPFILDSVTPMSEFTTVSTLGAIVVSFGHTITSKTITHTVQIHGGEDKLVENIGKAIVAHIPESMDTLLSLSQQ